MVPQSFVTPNSPERMSYATDLVFVVQRHNVTIPIKSTYTIDVDSNVAMVIH